MHGRTVWKGKRRKDGTRVGTSYYVCSAAIAKGRSICLPILFLQSPMDDFVVDAVGRRITSFLGKNGRATLKRLVVKELGSNGRDPSPEIRRLTTRLKGISTKTDSVIDLAASSPDCKDLLSDRLGRLRRERQEIEARLREIEPAPARITDPEAVVDAILVGLTDARQLFEHGTMEERKQVVRAFVDGLTVVGSKRCGEIRMKKLPVPQSVGTGRSYQSLAGVLYEVQKRNLAREPEVVPVAFTTRGTALVPV